MGTRHLYWILAGPTFAACSSPLKSPLFFLFMQRKFTLDATELNFSFYSAIPSEYSNSSTNSSDDFMPLFVMSVLLLLNLPFFLFMQRKFTLECDRTEFLFLQYCPLRVQRNFHQQLRRRRPFIRYVCSSPFKSPFFSFLCTGKLRWMRRN
jgi:hypothetical protein